MKLLVAVLHVLLSTGPFVPVTVRAENSCGGSYRGFQYTITSPNYPGNYSHGLDCVYRFRGDAWDKCEQDFHLQFLDFNVKASGNCKGDYLQVGERNVFCGSVTGLRKFKGTNNSLSVVFHSDERDADKGFKILVTAVPCNLKFNHNHFYRGFTEEGREDFGANDMPVVTSSRDVNDGDNDYGTVFSFADNSLVNGSSTYVRSAKEHKPVEPTKPTSSPGQSPPRITTYLFVPPSDVNASTRSNNGSAPLAARVTNANGLVSMDKSSSSTEQVRKSVVLPHRVYGEPSLQRLVDYDLQVTNDCDKTNAATSIRNSYDGFREQGFTRSSSANLVYDPNSGYFDPTNPNNNDRLNVPLTNYPDRYYQPGKALTSTYPRPSANYPGGINGQPSYPVPTNNNYQTGGFNPIAVGYSGYSSIDNNLAPYDSPYNALSSNYNPNNPNNPNNPIFNQNTGLGSSVGLSGSFGANYYNTGLIEGQIRECCRIPSSRRFSFSSPGFPGAAAGNPGSCRYTITKSSPDVCRLRLSFRYFNVGREDRYCSYGYVEIDGRRYCGCKSGQSVLVPFTDYIAKSVIVMSSGYPRSKFSGFLIDAVQEPCGLPGVIPYPPPYPSYPSYPAYPPPYPSYPGQVPYDPRNPSYPPTYPSRRENGSPTVVGKRSVPEALNGTARPTATAVISPSVPDPNPYIRSKRHLGYSYAKPSIGFPGPELLTQERFLDGRCQSRLFLDWLVASKEVIFKHVKCLGYGDLPLRYP